MNPTTSTDEVRNALVSIAENYQPTRRPRFKAIAPFKHEVRELRSRGASFATITELLKKYSVRVSHETVRRFYREIIEGKMIRRKRPRVRRNQNRPLPRTKPKFNGHAGHAQLTSSPPERGPRIARIEDL